MRKNTKSWKQTVQSLRADWFDLPTELRFPLVGVTVAELTAKAAMWVSLSRRPAEKVRGPKWLWVLGSFINGIGPAAYWTFGRK
ncbi:PLDc N-terminal domain-containing protein [uncultured Corynebacterium sp.]|uniref:PLDc N-terminal domain-containing protein n=1 Tax=uncultured Corynebacterium sp. TaxID=159447 RepID=UPI0025F60EFD|nr:PLDc N-terminal domain-containing protein [uncultured Corynebacterium sp.]